MAAADFSNDPVREWILTEGKATKIRRIGSVGGGPGGCINLANRYDTDVGSFFVKTNRSIGPEMFKGEAFGLSLMYENKVYSRASSFKGGKFYNQVGSLPRGGSFIIMEFIEFGPSRGDRAMLGRKLAEMHKASKSDKGFGFPVNNTIGSTPQINTWSTDWVQFYAEHRLGYQLNLALRQYGDAAIHEKDLWSGNISYDKNREPVILDPACYYGHNEAEFGMSWCAGFTSSFYSVYFEIMPKQPGYEQRRDLYLLYHYLNHYNLFGSGYRSSCMSIIDDYLRALKA